MIDMNVKCLRYYPLDVIVFLKHRGVLEAIHFSRTLPFLFSRLPKTSLPCFLHNVTFELRASLDYGEEVHQSVKNLISRQGYLKQQLVRWTR